MQKIKILGALAGLLLATQVCAADTVTVKGEVIDTYCYALMGAKGESHRKCGIACIEKGIAAGLLESGTDKVYVLLPNKDKSPLPKGVIDKMGRQATVTGKAVTIGGSQFLTVESIK